LCNDVAQFTAPYHWNHHGVAVPGRLGSTEKILAGDRMNAIRIINKIQRPAIDSTLVKFFMILKDPLCVLINNKPCGNTSAVKFPLKMNLQTQLLISTRIVNGKDQVAYRLKIIFGIPIGRLSSCI